MKRNQLFFIPAVGWFILSILLLTLPGSSFPKEDWLGKIWFDKWVHIGMFAILIILWCWAVLKMNVLAKNLRALFIWIAIAGLIYGIGMEFVQKYFIRGRSFDGIDIIADGLGAALGAFFSIRRYIKK